MDRRLAVSKITQLGLLAVSGFNLGRYSESFSGSSTAWFALVANIAVLAITLVMLIRDIWPRRG